MSGRFDEVTLEFRPLLFPSRRTPEMFAGCGVSPTRLEEQVAKEIDFGTVTEVTRHPPDAGGNVRVTWRGESPWWAAAALPDADAPPDDADAPHVVGGKP